MKCCVVDTETTGLDPRIHQPYEVSLWHEDWNEPRTFDLAHTLDHADPTALRIGRYFERNAHLITDGDIRPAVLAELLGGLTLVGSNPAFDAAMLTRFIGTPVWNHRMVDVAQAGMWVFGWTEPRGLSDVAAECRARGYDVPVPDHTASGDVQTTWAVYQALGRERCLRGRRCVVD